MCKSIPKEKQLNNSLCNNPNGVRGLSYADEHCIDRKVECILNNKKTNLRMKPYISPNNSKSPSITNNEAIIIAICWFIMGHKPIARTSLYINVLNSVTRFRCTAYVW